MLQHLSYLFLIEIRSISKEIMNNLIFQKNKLVINLEQSWEPRFPTMSCCLIYWPAKDTSISFRTFAIEEKIQLILSSPKSIDSSQTGKKFLLHFQIL